MTKRLCGAALFGALTLASCQVGSSPSSYRTATVPNGTSASVVLTEAGAVPHRGELVAVREDGLLLLLPEGLTVIAYEVIEGATFADARGVGSLRGEGEPRQRTRLAQFSRYPLGVSDELLTNLLESLDQERLIMVGP